LARRAVCSSSSNSAAKAFACERLFASVARWVQPSTARQVSPRLKTLAMINALPSADRR
jgi:hypothetical protein